MHLPRRHLALTSQGLGTGGRASGNSSRKQRQGSTSWPQGRVWKTFHVLSPPGQPRAWPARSLPPPRRSAQTRAWPCPTSSAHPGTQADAKALWPEAPAWARVTLDPVLSPVLLLVPDNMASGPALCWGTSGDRVPCRAKGRGAKQAAVCCTCCSPASLGVLNSSSGATVLGHCPHFHCEAQTLPEKASLSLLGESMGPSPERLPLTSRLCSSVLWLSGCRSYSTRCPCLMAGPAPSALVSYHLAPPALGVRHGRTPGPGGGLRVEGNASFEAGPEAVQTPFLQQNPTPRLSHHGSSSAALICEAFSPRRVFPWLQRKALPLRFWRLTKSSKRMRFMATNTTLKSTGCKRPYTRNTPWPIRGRKSRRQARCQRNFLHAAMSHL